MAEVPPPAPPPGPPAVPPPGFAGSQPEAAVPPPPGDPIAIDREALREPRRVSPFGPVFLAWAVVRQIGFLNIGIFTAVVGSRNVQLAGLAASLGLMIIGVARWWRFTYGLEVSDEGDQLVTLSGVFSRNRTSVPLDRIQAVSTRQNLLHRIVNLVEVNVQTAGSLGAEVQLTAVRPAVAERIRRLSTATTTSGDAETAPVSTVLGTDAPPMPPEADPVLRRSLSDVLVVAVTRNPLVLLAPIPLAVAFGIEAEEFLARFSDQAADVVDGIGGSVLGAVLAVFVVLLVSALISIGFVVLRLFDLRLFVDGAGLRRLSGLISRTEVTASRERVQLVAVRTNPLERLLGLRELVLPVAGGGASVQIGTSVPTALQLPGTRPDELERVADVVLGSDRHGESGHETKRGISPLAVRRWTLWGGALPAVAATIGLWFAIGWLALLALAWTPIMWMGAGLRQRSWRWSVGPETLRIRNGIIGEVRRDMPVRKAQNVEIDQGIFHRRHGLADVKIRTASRVQMVVPLLPLADARALRDELLYRAETDPRPFM